MKEHEGFISSHPGEDRDTDSEDENEDSKKPVKASVPIQDELINEDPAQEVGEAQRDAGELDQEMEQDE